MNRRPRYLLSGKCSQCEINATVIPVVGVELCRRCFRLFAKVIYATIEHPEVTQPGLLDAEWWGQGVRFQFHKKGRS
jgi:hypothetical protein